jgi:predicted metalloprotease with PDZ domain
MAIPTEPRETVDLAMAVWSPGFYRVEDYATRVDEISAHDARGAPLEIRRLRRNRWRVQAGRTRRVIVRYRLRCEEQSVTTNWVDEDIAVLNGPATFLMLPNKLRQPHEVTVDLPSGWRDSACGLPRSGRAHRYRARDFDELVDSPIVAGEFVVDRFSVGSCEHVVVAAGQLESWDRPRAVADLERIANGHLRLWGFFPFERYTFLLLLRSGGGGLEHRDCTLVTTHPRAMRSHARYRHWLGLACHEYFHAYNVKRLRPRELGPFDYLRPARTPSLWFAEGLTLYYGDLVLARSGLLAPGRFLARLSSHLELLQTSPGRRLQTVEESSRHVWTNSFSGLRPDTRSVSVYAKGAAVGFLLDARIRRETGGSRSLDEVMRLAYARHSGEHGFTSREIRRTISDAAGFGLGDWLDRALGSTRELRYDEALELFGLRFEPESWRLRPSRSATRAQREARRSWLGQLVTAAPPESPQAGRYAR